MKILIGSLFWLSVIIFQYNMFYLLKFTEKSFFLMRMNFLVNFILSRCNNTIQIKSTNINISDNQILIACVKYGCLFNEYFPICILLFQLWCSVFVSLSFFSFYQFDLMKLIKPFVEESCDVTLAASANSGSIALANCFPSSTPHWSNELMSQIIPCTKILCSYNAENIKKNEMKSQNLLLFFVFSSKFQMNKDV